MARVKYGSLIVDGSGSLGGHTFQRSNGCNQLRSKPLIKRKPSQAQVTTRSTMKLLQQSWRSLSETERSLWNSSYINGVSGYYLFLSLQFQYAKYGLELISTPSDFQSFSVSDGLMLYPELTKSTGWIFYSGAGYDEGHIYYTDYTFSKVRYTLTLPLNQDYLLQMRFTSTGFPFTLGLGSLSGYFLDDSSSLSTSFDVNSNVYSRFFHITNTSYLFYLNQAATSLGCLLNFFQISPVNFD